MKNALISVVLLIGLVGLNAQPQAFLLKWNSEKEYDTVCVFDNSTLSITKGSMLQLIDSNCLPVSALDADILSFSFFDDTYFLLHTVTVLSSISSSYPYFSKFVDSLRPGQYEIHCPHLKDSVYLQWLQNRWEGASYDTSLVAKPLLEIKSDYVLYKGDTFNRYDFSGRKDGRWIVYEIHNHIKKDTSSFFLPFDFSVISEQYYTSGYRDGTWKGYYSNDRIGFVCDFKNDELLSGLFYMGDGSVRYKFLFSRNGMYIFRDLTDKRKKFKVSEEELAIWLRL